MLTKEASNAVLKTLEEPPEHVIFVLCTTEMQSMLPTIRSRCQRFVFQRPGLPEIGAVLHRIAETESIDIDPAAIGLVARAAGGSFRDAVSTLDQLSTACDGRIGVADVRELLGTTDTEVLFQTLDLRRRRRCRRLPAADRRPGGRRRRPGDARHRPAGPPARAVPVPAAGRRRPRRWPPPTTSGRGSLTQADRLQPATVHRLVDLLRDANDQVREGADPRLPLELALVRICRPAGRARTAGPGAADRPARGGQPRSRACPASRRRQPSAGRAGGRRPAARRHLHRHRRSLRRRPTWTSSPSSGATPSCPSSRVAPSRWRR